MASYTQSRPYPRAAASPRKTASARSKPKHRAEIHGLRGLAIALVVMYHLWGAGRVSGGVDVFLMISAYLMVGSFVRRGTAFNLVDFLVNRFRKLIPQAWLVILTVMVTSWYVMPPLKWAGLLQQAASSLLYFQNWTLISLATNYNAADRSDTSVYQHFWSLSMQGQVFVIWPLIMMVAVYLYKFAKIEIRHSLAVIFSVIGVLSFGYAWLEIRTNPSAAYFDTWARLWEFALASVVALVPKPEMSRMWSMRLSWVGIAGVVLGGLVVGRQPFPGPAALVPALSAVLVIWGGTSRSKLHGGWWLSTKPLQWLGDRAYALYLWHWPVYMIYLYASDAKSLDFFGSGTVILLSLLLADVSTRVIDRGFNQWHVLNERPAAVMSMATFLVTGLASIQLMQFAVHTGLATAAPSNPPSIAAPPTSPSPQSTSAAPALEAYGGSTGRVAAPGDLQVKDDWPKDTGVCARELSVDGGVCFELPAQGQPAKTVVIFGDSHAWQWFTAMEPLARRDNWRVISYFKPHCRNTLVNPDSDAACADHSALVRKKIIELKPDAAFTVATRGRPTTMEEATDTHLEAMKPLLDAGIPVVNIRDNPRFETSRPECVQRYGSADARCWVRVEDKLAPVSPMVKWYQEPKMRFIDMTETICPQGVCPSVIDGIYVYMDDDHLSRTFVQHISPQFEAQVRAAMGL